MFISNNKSTSFFTSIFKSVLATGLVVSSFVACTSEVIEETKNETSTQQETIKTNPTVSQKTTQGKIDAEYFIGQWDMLPTHSSSFSYFLELQEGGVYKIALLTNGTSQDIAKGNWSIDSPNGDSKNFLRLEGFYNALYPAIGVDALSNAGVLDSFEIVEMEEKKMTISNAYAIFKEMNPQQTYFAGEFTLIKE